MKSLNFSWLSEMNFPDQHSVNSWSIKWRISGSPQRCIWRSLGEQWREFLVAGNHYETSWIKTKKNNFWRPHLRNCSMRRNLNTFKYGIRKTFIWESSTIPQGCLDWSKSISQSTQSSLLLEIELGQQDINYWVVCCCEHVVDHRMMEKNEMVMMHCLDRPKS